MSANFARTTADEGIDMPLKEPVTKAMLCMMFGLDENAFLYINTEDGTTACTMKGSEATFIPSIAGKYVVKTAEELVNVQNAPRDDIDQMENMIHDLEIGFYDDVPDVLDDAGPRTELSEIKRNNIFPDVSDENLHEILAAMSFEDYIKHAENSTRIQDMIVKNELKFSTTSQLKLHVTFQLFGPVFKIQDENDEKPHQFNFANWHLLKPFRFETIVINATNSNLNPKTIDNECSFIINAGFTAEHLYVEGLNKAQTVALAQNANVEYVTDGDKTWNFKPWQDLSANCKENEDEADISKKE